MKVRSLLVLVPLALTACSGEDTRTHEQCLVSCENSVTFTLAKPLSGREIEITVGEPDGSVQHVDCQPGDGSIACIPVVSPVKLTFDAAGALQSLKITSAPAGTFAVQIVVDGEPAAAGSFQFQPTVISSAPSPCPGGSYCLSSETFTIAN